MQEKNGMCLILSLKNNFRVTKFFQNMKTLILLLFAFTFANSGSKSLESSNLCEHTFDLTIQDSSGNPVPNATVNFRKCAMGSCNNALLSAYNTDTNGLTKVIWSNQDCSICTIIVNGVEFTGNWQNGNSYILTLS